MTYQIPEMYATLIISLLIGYGMNKGFIKLEDLRINAKCQNPCLRQAGKCQMNGQMM